MSLKAVSFGEVLWDIFPKYKNIGGAPLNVALRLQSFGIETTMISAIGIDENGIELMEYLSGTTLNTESIQKSNSNATGQVIVELDTSGSATYDIKQHAAWDSIEIKPLDIDHVQNANVFIYGSL